MSDQSPTIDVAEVPHGAAAQPPHDQQPWAGEVSVNRHGKLDASFEPSREQRLAAIQAAQNPLLEAAQPLLRALADMPADLTPEGIAVLHRLLEREVVSFQSICNSAHIKHEHVVAASYALCTAIDEAANSTSWGGGREGGVGVWAGSSWRRIFRATPRPMACRFTYVWAIPVFEAASCSTSNQLRKRNCKRPSASGSGRIARFEPKAW